MGFKFTNSVVQEPPSEEMNMKTGSGLDLKHLAKALERITLNPDTRFPLIKP